MKALIKISYALIVVLFYVGCSDPIFSFLIYFSNFTIETPTSGTLEGYYVKRNSDNENYTNPEKVEEAGFYYWPSDKPQQSEIFCIAQVDDKPYETGQWYFKAQVNDLLPATKYYIQAFIKINGARQRGNRWEFTTPDALPEQGTFTDSRDGHVYIWVRIGKQVWMGENLAWIPSISKPEEGSVSDKHYYIYGDDGTSQGQTPETYKTMGVLYNWSAAINACPEGWHLPTDVEWNELTSYLAYPEGSKMKEVGSAHWTDKNTDATNSSNFSARAGGQRYYLGGFMRLGTHAYFWTGTSKDDTYAWDRSLLDTGNRCLRGNSSKASGYSVRCVKN